MKAHGTAPGSGVDATTSMTLTDGQDGATDLAWTADVNVVGTVASLAARLMGGVTKKLTSAFFDKVREEIEAKPCVTCGDRLPPLSGRQLMKYPVSITVNGAKRKHHVEARLLLVHYLRETLGLTGTNVGCDTSQCGACTVLVDGKAVKSCTVLAVQADGAKVTTIEGLARDGKLHPLQEAFWEKHGAAVRLLHARA